MKKEKMKIDWFSFIMGIAWIIMSIVFFVANKDLGIVIIMIFVGIVNLLKSYFQERMSLKRLFKRKNKQTELVLGFKKIK